MERSRLRCVAGAAIMAASGCATVNPRADYDAAGQAAERATGQPALYRPDDTAQAAEQVHALLADGLTAEEAAQVALLNNPQLQAALYDVGVARADVVQAGLLSNPSLGFALRLPAAGGLANLDFDLAQNIADLWQIPARRRAAEGDLARTVLTIARQASETAAEAKAAYYAAVGADRRLEIANENLAVGRQVLELTELRKQAGAGSELDVNLARGVALEAELAVKEARLAAGSTRRRLATVLGLGTDADQIVLAEALPQPPAVRLDDALLIERAWAERLDVQAVRQAALAAEQRLALECRRVFPNVALGLAFEREARPRGSDRDLLADTARASIASGGLAAPEIEPRSARDVDTEFVIGPSLSMDLPIFDQNQAQIAKAKYEWERATRVLDGLERTLRQQVQEALDQAQTAWEVAVHYRDQLVPQAERSLEMSREAYRAGKSSILSVLDAERTFLTTRDRYAAALERAAAAVPQLEQAIGLPWARLIEPASEAGRGGNGDANTTPSNETDAEEDAAGAGGEE